MKKICTVNYYPHINLASASGKDKFCCEIECINEITKAVVWKCYFGDTQRKASAIAQAQATKFQNRMIRIYG